MKKTILNIIGILIFFLIIFQMISSKESKHSNSRSFDGKQFTTKGNAQLFYRLLGEALHKMENRDFEGALPLLEEALPYAGLQPEIAMVHHQLAKIYREKGDYKNELISQRAILKYTLNQDVKKESSARIEELSKFIERQAGPLATQSNDLINNQN